ncbi:hypothetical protein [Variovorax sp. 770b2]|uniref:hypothetical protein n=1 Tax=Variovorax sp. 770b2 TaxID=1566271 RepID=UPI0008E8CF01|nr:hypothetical protein [Variovorax sp. 770b2]SFQ40315.1 hypothetical protein SAMN03159339_0309 [Variovorax sp. 770b2]
MDMSSVPKATSKEEAAMALEAHQCLVAALEHSKAGYLQITVEDGTRRSPLKIPARALRILADVLDAMAAEQEPPFTEPQACSLTTEEAAIQMEVARPFAGKKRSLETSDAPPRHAAQESSKQALDELVKLSQNAGMEL